MAITVKTDWQYGDIPLPEDFNRIEQNIWDVYQANLTTATANYALESATANYALLSADSLKLGGLNATAYATLGETNSDYNLWNAMAIEVDTRSTAITYDASGNISLVEEKDPTTGDVYRSYSLSYDANGNLMQVVETAGGKTITYTLTYDTNGNLISVSKEVV